MQAWDRWSKETIQNFFWSAGIYLVIPADVVEDYDDPFKLLQSDLDELKLLNPTVVPHGTNSDDFTGTDQSLSMAEPTIIDYEKILNHCWEPTLLT